MPLNVWQRNITDEHGNVISGAEVEVFFAGLATKPTLKSSLYGASLTNPFDADVAGFAQFYANDGLYDIAVNGDIVWSDVQLGNNIIDNVAALSSITAVAGQVYKLKEYHAGTGVGGGDLVAFAGTATIDGGLTLAGPHGYYFKRTGYSEIHVNMYGANGAITESSATDETSAILAACAAAQADPCRVLRFGPFYYKISSTITVTEPIFIRGTNPAGEGFPGGITDTVGTKITWLGGFFSMMFISNVNMGGLVENIHFDANGLAAYCVHADTVVFWKFRNIWCEKARVYGYILDSRFGTCSWNIFEQCRFSAGYNCSAVAALHFAGYEGGYNVCHNTMINTIIEHAGDAIAMQLGFCDNCTFHDTYINRSASGFAGVSNKPGVGYVASGSSYAYSNFFFHLQAGNGV